MSMTMPDFIEWLDENEPGWVLREDAPPEIVKSFNEFLEKEKENKEKGIDM